jgi:molecular chaperone DnaK (HSP70)
VISIPNQWSYYQRVVINSALLDIGIKSVSLVSETLALAMSLNPISKKGLRLIISIGSSITSVGIFTISDTEVSSLSAVGMAEGLDSIIGFLISKLVLKSDSPLSKTDERQLRKECELSISILRTCHKSQIIFQMIEYDLTQEYFRDVICASFLVKFRKLINECLLEAQVSSHDIIEIEINGLIAPILIGNLWNDFKHCTTKVSDNGSILKGLCNLSGFFNGHFSKKIVESIPFSIGIQGNNNLIFRLEFTALSYFAP